MYLHIFHIISFVVLLQYLVKIDIYYYADQLAPQLGFIFIFCIPVWSLIIWEAKVINVNERSGLYFLSGWGRVTGLCWCLQAGGTGGSGRGVLTRYLQQLQQS